jgi:hypothetical protein
VTTNCASMRADSFIPSSNSEHPHPGRLGLVTKSSKAALAGRRIALCEFEEVGSILHHRGSRFQVERVVTDANCRSAFTLARYRIAQRHLQRSEGDQPPALHQPDAEPAADYEDPAPGDIKGADTDSDGERPERSAPAKLAAEGDAGIQLERADEATEAQEADSAATSSIALA